LPDAKITIAVPSYNQGHYLDAALSSIFDQALPIEVFVMDGGSTDNSLRVIKRWEHRLSGWRSQQDNGQAAAINEGITQGTAPYVCWLNSDDFFYPDGLAKLLGTLTEHPDRQFVYAKCWTVSASGRKLAPYLTMPFSPRLFANFCFIAQPATLITRAAWEQLGGLDDSMQMAFDYDLWWRLFAAYGKPGYCKAAVAATRMHQDTKTANQIDLHYKESIDLVRRNWGTVPLKWRVFLPVMKMIRSSRGSRAC
jgi:glycosyltransferase involved in cell wall biosynthesis